MRGSRKPASPEGTIFEAELPPRGGILEIEEAAPEAARRARLDRADKACDAMVGALAILTCRHEDQVGAVLIGTLATASQDPPRISVAIRQRHPIMSLLRASGTFAVNLIGQEQEGWVKAFSQPGELGEAALAGVKYEGGVWTGAPVLEGSLGFLECEAVAFLATGDHTLVVADLLDGGSLREGSPMIRPGAYKPTGRLS